jgi:hypothetical protein
VLAQEEGAQIATQVLSPQDTKVAAGSAVTWLRQNVNKRFKQEQQ